MTVDRKYRKALALPCLMSEPLPNAANSSDVLRFDVTRVTQVTVLITINTGVFLGKMCSDRRKNRGCGQKKPEGISPARFGIRTAAKCGELKRCADRVGSRTDNKDEVVEGKFSNLNFLPSTKKTTEYSFELFLSINKINKIVFDFCGLC